MDAADSVVVDGADVDGDEDQLDVVGDDGPLDDDAQLDGVDDDDHDAVVDGGGGELDVVDGDDGELDDDDGVELVGIAVCPLFLVQMLDPLAHLAIVSICSGLLDLFLVLKS